VSRTLSVHSDPPGASVIIDGKRVGTTPYEQTYDSYGTRSLDLELPGYVSRHEHLDMPLPWWQYFPLDVVTDLLLPLGLHDDYAFSFALAPLDPDAGTWDDAHVALAREQAQREATLRAADAATQGARADVEPGGAGDTGGTP